MVISPARARNSFPRRYRSAIFAVLIFRDHALDLGKQNGLGSSRIGEGHRDTKTGQLVKD